MLTHPRTVPRVLDWVAALYTIGQAVGLTAAGVPLWAVAVMTVFTVVGFTVISLAARRHWISLTDSCVVPQSGFRRLSIPFTDVIEMWPQTPTERGPIRIRYSAPRSGIGKALVGDIRVGEFRELFYNSKERFPVVRKIVWARAQYCSVGFWSQSELARLDSEGFFEKLPLRRDSNES